jgi:hypothetical protein
MNRSLFALLLVLVAATVSASRSRNPLLRKLLADTHRGATPISRVPELQHVFAARARGAPLPKSFSWAGKCARTTGTNEGQCGTGTVSMTVANVISGVGCVLNGGKFELISARQLTDCYNPSYLCDGSEPNTLISGALNATQGLLATDASYPFGSDTNGTAAPCKPYGWTVASTQVTSFVALPPKDETLLQHVLVNTGPFAVVVDPSYFYVYKKGTILTGKSCVYQQYEHMLTVIGYGERVVNSTSTIPYWIALDTIGPDSGEGADGIVLLERGVNCLGLAGQPSTVTVTKW